MLERFRGWSATVLGPIARLLVRLGVSPDVVTVVGTLGVALGALICFPQGWLWQGVLVVTIFVILISVWTTLLVALTLIPIVVVMRQIAKSDDQQFRLLGLKLLFRAVHYNHNAKFWRASTYSPIAFKKRK